ncbi:MAG: cation transporting ATPase C-terminal domain-containing protein, partial [Candidatus Heimdallarchaeaceae archaeon]
WMVRSSFDDPFKKRNPFNNKLLIISVVLGVVLQLAIIYIPFGNVVFHTEPLTILDWLIALGFIIGSMILLGVSKTINLAVKGKTIVTS